MFYSQFILAKKGPLGTIWIAAHLERKLRKNQVADTDIGVSVDSILFPEAPIALRLSSHLLLGVVRIYSRKVNYLFHDCSEALLKIKQAFRSTAVDLPPEESTAPYHSITLPETFHLDDFELPDVFLHGNSVDHHVSTREQITLQDTMDGVVYSTSKFGLDERFGDGDASQIGLELDEDLFLGKVPSPQHASGPLGEEDEVHHDRSSIAVTSVGIDDGQIVGDADPIASSPMDLSGFVPIDCDMDVPSDFGDFKMTDDPAQRHGYNIQTPDLNEVFSPNNMEGPSATNKDSSALGVDESSPMDLVESAQAPLTPGLMEEATPANFEDFPALSPQEKNSPSADLEAIRPDNCCSPRMESEFLDATNIHEEAVTLESTDIVREMPSSSLGTTVPKPMSGELLPITEASLECGQKGVDNSLNAFASSALIGQSIPNEMHDKPAAVFAEAASSGDLVHDTGKVGTCKQTTETILESGLSSEINHVSLEDRTEASINGDQDCVADVVPCSTANVSAVSLNCFLRPCDSQFNQEEMRTYECSTADKNALLCSLRDPGCSSEAPASESVLHATGSSVLIQGEDSRSGIATDSAHQKMEHMSSDAKMCAEKSSSSEFPEPEKMLEAANGATALPDDLIQGTEATAERGIAESDGSVDRTQKTSGRKRRQSESTPALQIGSSAKLPGRPRLRRNTDYVPDDDDVLASILVGRNQVLNLAPTPPLKGASQKRPRLTPRVGLTKRKVLFDDAMVLHADTIRQQLMSTEDIRRIRKKAPCTRSEIWMIQKLWTEEEIFDESVLPGIAELNDLHNSKCDLKENRNFQLDGSHTKLSKEEDLSRNSDFAAEREENRDEPVAIAFDKIDGEEKGPPDTSVSKDHNCIDAEDYDAQKRVESVHDACQLVQSNSMYTEELDVHDDRTAGDMPKLGSRNSENQEEISTDCAVEKTGHESHEVGASVTGDDLCMDPKQQLEHELVLPPDDLRVISNETAAVVEDGDNSVGPMDVCTAHDSSVMEDKTDKTADALNLMCSSKCHVGASEVENDVTLLAVDGIKVGEDYDNDASVLTSSTNCIASPKEGMESADVAAAITAHQAVKEAQSGLEHGIDDEATRDKLLGHEKNPEMAYEERTLVESSCTLLYDTEIDNAPSTVGENTCLQECDLGGGLDAECAPFDFAAARDSGDFCSEVDGNDTGFLNVDDEAEYNEEADDDVPNPEGSQSLENSGWSSRTRGVARYLKSLFDDESGRGRKAVVMDQLLVGKTRKEASRMFFETLVLKTKDYIQAEQENPFNRINIKPRSKLLKSEF